MIRDDRTRRCKGDAGISSAADHAAAAPAQGERTPGGRSRSHPGAQRTGLPPAHHRQRQADPDQVRGSRMYASRTCLASAYALALALLTAVSTAALAEVTVVDASG